MSDKKKEAAVKEKESTLKQDEIEAEAEQGKSEDSVQSQAASSETKTSSDDELQTEGEAILDNRLEELRKEADENYQRYLRAQADFDNFRRRTRQEKEESAKYASLPLIEQLLPVVDNFERAIDSSKETNDFDALVKGLEMTFRQLDQVLKQEGLEQIEAVGQPFNPEYHQAVMQVESEEHEEGIIVEELQKGYKLKEKVVRPAMVKVSM
ncbi:nucleotide exchange factor GrpE [Paenibacillus sp. J2TS4]|uniref:nucleotide exchange factor GrpE n=1 Tax=Paenibacillus sp. J2TS4 TaxID=2807194 RepID=UPI001B1444DA|nr:nucleotide exchange factor GrpE [Paenibacillus sp. J2TS4]GIP35856.1 nucleotide exchange factor GrpE [Paenibacillus sp. J2TS4]